MAHKQRSVEICNPDRENHIMTKYVKPITEINKVQIKNRPALGELGNKIHNQKNEITTFKKKEMGPPIAIPKKTLNNENKVDRPQIKRQESIVTSNNIKCLVKETATAYSSKQLSIIDPDEGSKNEPQMVTEYLGDIFSYLRGLEIKYPIDENYLENHKSTPRMRTVLVNWFVDVHQNFKLCLETLHLCVSIVDRYLQINKNVGKETLQLVGTAAMFIASKYEEMYLPELEDFCYICDDTFSKKQILQMEIDILKKLDFNLGRPLSIHFLRRYSKVAQVKSDHHTLGKYILELALQEYKLCHIKPSIIAAAACYLSVAILDDILDVTKIWTPTMVHYTTYDYSDIKPVVIELGYVIAKCVDSKYQAVRTKYASSKFAKISLTPKLNGPLITRLVALKHKVKK